MTPIRNGLGEPAIHDNHEWPRYVRTTDIQGPHSLRQDIFASLPPETAAKAPLLPGDLVMSAAGSVGKSLLHTDDSPACYAGYLVRFRPREGVDSRYVSYWAQSGRYWEQIDKGKVTSTIDNFSASKYQNLTIELPPHSEQVDISDYLDTAASRVDSLTERAELSIERLREYRSAVISAAVTGKIDVRDEGQSVRGDE